MDVGVGARVGVARTAGGMVGVGVGVGRPGVPVQATTRTRTMPPGRDRRANRATATDTAPLIRLLLLGTRLPPAHRIQRMDTQTHRVAFMVRESPSGCGRALYHHDWHGSRSQLQQATVAEGLPLPRPQAAPRGRRWHPRGPCNSPQRPSPRTRPQGILALVRRPGVAGPQEEQRR